MQFKNSTFHFIRNVVCKTFQFITDQLSSYYSPVQFSAVQFVRKKNSPVQFI